jgi:hypothetical protein
VIEKQRRVIERPRRGVPLLAAVGTLVAGFVIAVVLFAVGLNFLGFVAAAAGVPAAFAVWLMLATRL